MKQETDRWLSGLMKGGCAELNGKCHDCGVTTRLISTKSEIEGGYVWKYEGIEAPFFKCIECYEKQPKLENYQPCEVYSRVVGYLRPVKQWNKGKREEMKLRKPFVMGSSHA